jgi:hypothetical protein
MTEEKLREELYAAFKNRAMMYYHTYEALKDEVGADRAASIMKRAIHRRGLEIGQRFAAFGPSDLAGLQEAFVAAVPDEGRMFSPKVLRCDADALEIELRTCPLKEAWQEAGLSGDEVARLCDIAAAVDFGTFQGAGFSFSAETWRPGKEGCCRLRIGPGTGV